MAEFEGNAVPVAVFRLSEADQENVGDEAVSEPEVRSKPQEHPMHPIHPLLHCAISSIRMKDHHTVTLVVTLPISVL